MVIAKWTKRDARLRVFYVYSEISKLVLKGLLASNFLSAEDKFFFFLKFKRFSFKNSLSYYSRSCLFTGHARSVFRIFRLSRHQAKYCASNGFLTGLRKSSF